MIPNILKYSAVSHGKVMYGLVWGNKVRRGLVSVSETVSHISGMNIDAYMRSTVQKVHKPLEFFSMLLENANFKVHKLTKWSMGV